MSKIDGLFPSRKTKFSRAGRHAERSIELAPEAQINRLGRSQRSRFLLRWNNPSHPRMVCRESNCGRVQSACPVDFSKEELILFAGPKFRGIAGSLSQQRTEWVHNISPKTKNVSISQTSQANFNRRCLLARIQKDRCRTYRIRGDLSLLDEAGKGCSNL